MSNNERKRRSTARGRLARKRKQKRRMTAIMLGIICVLLVILFVVNRKGKGGDDVNSARKSGQETATGTTSTVDTTLSDAVPTVTFTEEQKYMGDLVLVNSSYPYDFDANAQTIALANIRDTQRFYYQVQKTDYEVAGRIMPYLDQLVAACDEAVGTKLTGVASAYRSLEYQQAVWDEMAELNGTEYAEQYVASPGYSEHHTGLAVDMSIFYEDGSEGSFSESENAVWMNENAYHYGFVRRYAEDKISVTGISNEAWHFRYVGIPHATYMVANNLCLEEYIDYLRTNASVDHPLSITCDDGTYEVFFTTLMTIEEPEGEYTVSGNNVDGYIITVRVS